MGDITANRGLAHTDIDHVGIRFSDSESANRSAFEESIGDVLPVLPAIGGLPDSSTGGAEVEYLWVDWIACHSYHAPTAKGADGTPLKRGQERGSHFAACELRGVRYLLVPVTHETVFFLG